ncbi:MAG: DUF2933 domain-containing protein [Chloroflexi bacterium]|nr:MAG: DUF2933 domain-containing protein [Chloroflexota bacterium]
MRRHHSPLKAIWDCVQMCLNWKVLASLAVVVLLIGVVAPQLFWAALPALVALVCPLSMVVMMAQMGKRRGRPTVAHPMEPECPACLYEAPSVQEAHEAAAEQEALPRVPLKR